MRIPSLPRSQRPQDRNGNHEAWPWDRRECSSMLAQQPWVQLQEAACMLLLRPACTTTLQLPLGVLHRDQDLQVGVRREDHKALHGVPQRVPQGQHLQRLVPPELPAPHDPPPPLLAGIGTVQRRRALPPLPDGLHDAGPAPGRGCIAHGMPHVHVDDLEGRAQHRVVPAHLAALRVHAPLGVVALALRFGCRGGVVSACTGPNGNRVGERTSLCVYTSVMYWTTMAGSPGPMCMPGLAT